LIVRGQVVIEAWDNLLKHSLLVADRLSWMFVEKFLAAIFAMAKQKTQALCPSVEVFYRRPGVGCYE